ncbi:MAG: hypothetical protein C0453_07595 [Comamonadaceae bacterium]|nr:hypothetical protein [Comamonadaceae bacterium]
MRLDLPAGRYTVLTDMPRQTASGREPSADPGKAAGARLGIEMSELPPVQRRRLDIDYGLMVRNVGGAFAGSELRPGDVIVAVNQQRFTGLAEFQRSVDATSAGDRVAVLVRRGDASLFVALEVGAG